MVSVVHPLELKSFPLKKRKQDRKVCILNLLVLLTLLVTVLMELLIQVIYSYFAMKKIFRLKFKFSVLTVSCPFPKWTTYKISFDIFISLKTIQIKLAKTKIICPKNMGASVVMNFT